VNLQSDFGKRGGFVGLTDPYVSVRCSGLCPQELQRTTALTSESAGKIKLSRMVLPKFGKPPNIIRVNLAELRTQYPVPLAQIRLRQQGFIVLGKLPRTLKLSETIYTEFVRRPLDYRQ
jgi:hypothetical protein